MLDLILIPLVLVSSSPLLLTLTPATGSRRLP